MINMFVKSPCTTNAIDTRPISMFSLSLVNDERFGKDVIDGQIAVVSKSRYIEHLH